MVVKSYFGTRACRATRTNSPASRASSGQLDSARIGAVSNGNRCKRRAVGGEKTEVVGQYKNCDVIRLDIPSDAKYHYTLYCEK